MIEEDVLISTAQTTTRILLSVPFVQYVYFSSIRLDSDIDVLIISSRHRIWLTRLLVSVILHIFGFKKTNKMRIGRVCLNYFLEEGNFTIRPKTHYESSFFSHLQESTEASAHYKKNFAKSNKWISDILKLSETSLKKKFANTSKSIRVPLFKCKKSFITKFVEDIFSLKLFDFLEKLSYRFQRHRILRKIHNRIEKNGIIVLTNREVRFHEHAKSFHY